MATQFGTAAPFGIAAAETGIILDSISYGYEHEMKQIRNVGGDTTGKSYYDERITVSMSGFLPTSSPFSTTLAAAITLVTAPTDLLIGSVGTTTICESITLSSTSEDYRRIEVSATNHPLIV
jgi:hypothetical protein